VVWISAKSETKKNFTQNIFYFLKNRRWLPTKHLRKDKIFFILLCIIPESFSKIQDKKCFDPIFQAGYGSGLSASARSLKYKKARQFQAKSVKEPLRYGPLKFVYDRISGTVNLPEKPLSWNLIIFNKDSFEAKKKKKKKKKTHVQTPSVTKYAFSLADGMLG